MSELYKLNLSDAMKALAMTVICAAVAPLAAVVVAPNFDLFSADWATLLKASANGALVGGVGYLFKNFLSDAQGKVVGKIG